MYLCVKLDTRLAHSSSSRKSYLPYPPVLLLLGNLSPSGIFKYPASIHESQEFRFPPGESCLGAPLVYYLLMEPSLSPHASAIALTRLEINTEP